MPQSNIYEAGAAPICDLFADFIDGDSSKIALVLSTQPLEGAGRTAIENSLAAFGYGSDVCAFVTTKPKDSSVEGGDIALDPPSIFMLVEALDPLMVIVADEPCARLVAQAYHGAFDLDAATRLFGRPSVVFRNLTDLVATDEGKQKAWKALKSLPKR